MKESLPRLVRHPLRLNDPVYRWDNCPTASTQPVRFGQMYPGRRFALPWAISFCPFGAAGSMVDCCLPGPSTPAEGVPALRAYGPQDCYLPGPSTPVEGMPALWAYELQDATYRGLRPRQRVYRPFGPLRHKMLLSGAFDPGRGCAGPSGLCAIRCYLPGPSTPAEGVPALRAYELQDCYLPGPSTPAEGVLALRAYELQDAIFRGLRPRQRVCQPFGPMTCGVNSGAVKVTVTPSCGSDFQNGSGTVDSAINSSSKRSSCLATRLNSMCLPRTSPSQAQPPEL